jgi:hypothetical protein
VTVARFTPSWPLSVTIARWTLHQVPFAGRTGRDVRVAVVDSGIAAGHPHVGAVTESVRIAVRGSVATATAAGAIDAPARATGASDAPANAVDVLDRLGHGTAVAAAIREKAPATILLSVKVFDRTLTTTANRLAEGIVWSADHGAQLINLSLGTANPEREQPLREAVAHAVLRGSIVVSASESAGIRWLPGSLPGVVSVREDYDCDRDALEVTRENGGAMSFRASAYPRPIPGVPRERNLSGVSFAVANVTGFLARLLEGHPEARSMEDIARLLSGASGA